MRGTSTRADGMVRAAFTFGIYDYSTNDVRISVFRFTFYGSTSMLIFTKVFIFLYIYGMPVSYVILKSPPKMFGKHCILLLQRLNE